MDQKITVKKRIKLFLFRYRIFISAVVFGLLIYEDWNEGLKPQSVLDFNPLGIFAVILILFGAFFRSWAAGTIKKTKQLATEGAYSLTRHPLYVGSLLIAIGFSLLLWDNENFWAVLGVFFILYFPKIKSEEAKLSNLFKEEWISYCQKTAIFYPKKLPQLKSSWSWAQWIYNKEYKAFSVSMISIAILMINKPVI